MATKRKIRMKRATADRLLAELIERCASADAGAGLHRVTKVVVFGSYLTDKPTLGDLDIALSIERVYRPGESSDAWVERADDYTECHAPPSVLANWWYASCYPERAFKSFLRGRSGRVHLTPDLFFTCDPLKDAPRKTVWTAPAQSKDTKNEC